jgi:hypothetical protein
VSNKSGFLSSIIKRIDMERVAVRAVTPRCLGRNATLTQ